MFLRAIQMVKLAEMMEELTDEQVADVVGIEPGSTQLDSVAFSGGASKGSLGPVRPQHATRLVEDETENQ
jgi:hypothetical protein